MCTSEVRYCGTRVLLSQREEPSGVKMKANSGEAWSQGGSALIPHVTLTPASKLYPWPVAAGSGGLCGLDLLYS